jgi:GMP synthase (glutamine-hydrolysing)
MKPLRIHIIQHIEAEKPGLIEKWISINNHTVSFTYVYKNQLLPDLKDFDLLIIMGGSASVYETQKYKWITPELEFINKCVVNGKAVFGICLGSQLIAAALGAKVYKAPFIEIGWHEVKFNQDIIHGLPEKKDIFQWHGDTFDIPKGAKCFASTEGVPNQAFIYGDKTIAMQFHLEVSSESIDLMLEHFAEHIIPGKYIQTIDEIKGEKHNIEANEKILYYILNLLSDRIK